jgi:hypothetical protein
MASQLLSNLQDLIDNARQTQSGKVEWSATSLKGILEEILSLFSTNALQTAYSTSSLITLEGANGFTAIVTSDSDGKYNGVYTFDATNYTSPVYFSASNGGYWSMVLPFSIGDFANDVQLAVDSANAQLELGSGLVLTGTHTVIDKWIKVNIPGVGTRYLPLYI